LPTDFRESDKGLMKKVAHQCLTSLLLIVSFTTVSGCGLLKKKEPEPEVQLAMSEPLEPEEAQELLGEIGGNWLYGEGIGSTLLNVGAIVLFPPYGLYLLGNGLISVAGYEPLYVTSALPEEQQKDYNSFYSELVSSPGRLSAFLAEKDYRDKKEIKERLKQFQERVKAERQNKGSMKETRDADARSLPSTTDSVMTQPTE
jgi:hypothetical protein